MKFFKFNNKFLLLATLYAFVFLVGLFFLTLAWLPPGYTIAGHDSGLPLDAKQFLSTRLYSWDDRIGFGIDNSVNFGSLTIHFIDWIASVVAGTPYAGNYISVFFWLGLIFVSGLVFSYQLKDILGRVFVFVLPVLLTFNFYIFQSMFMLERAKFGVFSALLITLAVYFRLQQKKLEVLPAALITALVFSIFNGGGLFAITLYGGVVIILAILVIYIFVRGLENHNFGEFKEILRLLVLSAVFYLIFNAYAILPYVKQFSANNPQAIFQDSLISGNKEWLAYVSRSSSYLNLFRFLGVPDWYAGSGQVDKANVEHPYASIYLDNLLPTALSFLFPILSFASLLLAKKGIQRKTLSLFAVISLAGLFFTAGSHKPLGFIYEFLMEYVPGFVLFRSAFYKFGVFYLLGTLVLFAFTLSFFAEKLAARFVSIKLYKPGVVIFTLLVLGLWVSYHWVLFDSTKVFSWKSDQSTKVMPPSYIYDFSHWVEKNNLGEKRVLLLPPVNKDWQSDAYDWGYWSLSQLPYALSTARVISKWHGFTNEELGLVNRIYSSIEKNDEKNFLELAEKLNIGYLLLRQDVLTDSKWTSSERPENYKNTVESFDQIKKTESFGKWDFYKINSSTNSELYATSSLNLATDRYISLANEFFTTGHNVGSSVTKLYPEFMNISAKKMEVFDCLSCAMERKDDLQSLPEVTILPNSLLYSFKERQEQKLLSTPKDSWSRVADYLGLVLRRSAEQQRMIDLQLKDKHLVKNASVIRSYLEKIYTELVATPEKAKDFEVAIQVLEYLNQADRVFSDQATRSDFKFQNERLTDEILGVVWEIERIKEFFAPLLDDSERWATQKVYKVALSDDGKYDIFFPSGSLPRDISGQPILPQSVDFEKDGKTNELEVKTAEDGWFTTRINESKGVGRFIMHFAELPNLLNIESSALEKFSFGKAACYQGSIANFDQKRAYEVRVWKSDRLKPAKIIFRDKTFAYSERHGFLQGEDSFEIPASAEGGYARYIFFPSASADIISLYICSDTAELPPIDKIDVREYFSPPVIGISGGYPDAGDKSADIQYQRKNPTSYQVEASDIGKNPYVLVFNEKFNPSWKLSIEKQDGSSITVAQHFMVDGFANGWLISDPSAKKFNIEYAPQNIFYKASMFSLASIPIAISWLIFSIFWKRKKHDI